MSVEKRTDFEDLVKNCRLVKNIVFSKDGVTWLMK